MSDSNTPEHLDAKPDRTREQRIEGIKRWVEYINSEPPEAWGPQQNAVVDAQLEAAQGVRTAPSHKRRVQQVANEIIAARDASSTESDSSRR